MQDPLKRRLLSEAGAIQCILAGMWAHTGPREGLSHPEVQEWGINTLLATTTRSRLRGSASNLRV